MLVLLYCYCFLLLYCSIVVILTLNLQVFVYSCLFCLSLFLPCSVKHVVLHANINKVDLI